MFKNYVACIHAYTHTHTHTYIYIYTCRHTQQICVHITTFKATKDIAAGQEIFIWYGNAQWFERKNILRADVDYASTMWRPGLHPLQCRQSVAQATGADGRHSFFVRKAIPSGTVLEVSVCLEVSVVAIDQFPFLWDFVLTGETENKYIGCQQTSASSRAHAAYVFADQGEGNIGERAERVLHFIYPLTLFQWPNPSSSTALSTICHGLRVRVKVLRLHRPEVRVYVNQTQYRPLWTRSNSICIDQTNTPSRTHALHQSMLSPQF